MIGEVLGGLLGELVAGTFGALRRDGGGSEPETMRIAAALRVPGGGLDARWRHGSLRLDRHTGWSWVPRWPRLGRRVALPGLELGRRRPMTLAEQWWWLSPGLHVFAVSGRDGEVELAVPADDVDRLRAPRPDPGCPPMRLI